MRRVFSFAINDFQRAERVIKQLRRDYGGLCFPENGAFGMAYYATSSTPLMRKGPRDGGTSPLDDVAAVKPSIALASFEKRASASFQPQENAPFRFRDWSFTMGANFSAPSGFDHRTLPMPNYIRANMNVGSLEEVMFHLFLAFMHSRGTLFSESPPVEDVYESFRGANSLLEGLTEVSPDEDHGDDGVSKRGYVAIVSNGRSVYALNAGMPLWFINPQGLGLAEEDEEAKLEFRNDRAAQPHLRYVVVR